MAHDWRAAPDFTANASDLQDRPSAAGSPLRLTDFALQSDLTRHDFYANFFMAATHAPDDETSRYSTLTF
jgi:hypothetical protein